MPASPSPSRFRVERFKPNRSYFRRRLRFGKTGLTIIATLAAFGWLIYGRLDAEADAYRYSHGPVAKVHATWDNRCEACHEPFSRKDFSLTSLFSPRERWRSFRCDGCHAGSIQEPKNFAPHHAVVRDPEMLVGDCSSCHKDHQGRDHSLTLVGDASCTRCHANLQNYHAPDARLYTKAMQIKDFASHPEFQPTQAKPNRTLRFSHSVHMTAGIVYDTAAAKNPKAIWKISDLPENQRARYRKPGQTDASAVQLDCASCHISEGVTGAYYQPVKYEQACAACHPNNTSEYTDAAGSKIAPIDLPHGLQPEKLDEWMRGIVATRTPQTTANFAEKVSATVAALRRPLYRGTADNQVAVGGQGCAKCHQLEPTGSDTPTTVVAISSPAIWYPHARFEHRAHNAVSCKECHANKEATVDVKGSTIATYGDREPLGIPGIENCKQCHGPKRDIVSDGITKSVGGARSNCVECHTYHDGDHGGRNRDTPPSQRTTSTEFLRGISGKRE